MRRSNVFHLIMMALVITAIVSGCGGSDGGGEKSSADTGMDNTAPTGVTLATSLDDVTGVSIPLSWDQSTADDFSSYKIYGSTSSSMDSPDLLTTISDASTLSYVATGLIASTTYYFKVYVCDTEGACTGSNTLSASTLSNDLYFIPDPGIRVESAGVPLAEIAPDDTVYLYYADSLTDTQKLATSTDGLTFTAGQTPTTYIYNPKYHYMPDGRWRTYYFDQHQTPPAIVSRSTADGTNPLLDSGSRYTLRTEDNGVVGIIDIFKDSLNNYVMIYLSDLFGLNNARRAYSTDNGDTFTWTTDNVFGDADAGGGYNTYVDQYSIPLGGTTRRMFVMTGSSPSPTVTTGYIDSFITTDDGTTFTKETGHRVSHGDFTEITVRSLHDPSVIKLPDGRYRMYVCARIDNPSGSGSEFIIVSATTPQ